MKLKKLFTMSLVLGTLSGSLTMISPNVHADDASSQPTSFNEANKLVKQANASGKKMQQLKLVGKWHSYSKVNQQIQGEYVSFGKDGSLNWAQFGGVGNNTTIMKVTKFHKGWTKLNIRYPDGTYLYGFVRKTTIKVKGHSRAALLFGVNKKPNPKKVQEVMVATKSSKVLPVHKTTEKAFL